MSILIHLKRKPTEQEVNILKERAKEYGYKSCESAISYAAEPSIPKFQAEGKAFRAWRSKFWDAINTVKQDVLSNKRTIPSFEELIQEVPTLNLEPSTLT